MCVNVRVDFLERSSAVCGKVWCGFGGEVENLLCVATFGVV